MISIGQIIVATPSLKDRFFGSSVVLLTEQNDRGWVGITLNKPSSISMANIAEEKGWSWPFDANVYMGGPVNQHALVMVHSADWWSTNTMPISDTVSISSDNFMTEKMVMGNAPLDWRLCHGIAAWRNGQLEAEIARNDWLIAWPTAEILWSHSGEDQWHKSIELCANQAVETFF